MLPRCLGYRRPSVVAHAPCRLFEVAWAVPGRLFDRLAWPRWPLLELPSSGDDFCSPIYSTHASTSAGTFIACRSTVDCRQHALRIAIGCVVTYQGGEILSHGQGETFAYEGGGSVRQNVCKERE